VVPDEVDVDRRVPSISREVIVAGAIRSGSADEDRDDDGRDEFSRVVQRREVDETRPSTGPMPGAMNAPTVRKIAEPPPQADAAATAPGPSVAQAAAGVDFADLSGRPSRRGQH
jgi:hypothetical protein